MDITILNTVVSNPALAVKVARANVVIAQFGHMAAEGSMGDKDRYHSGLAALLSTAAKADKLGMVPTKNGRKMSLAVALAAAVQETQSDRKEATSNVVAESDLGLEVDLDGEDPFSGRDPEEEVIPVSVAPVNDAEYADYPAVGPLARALQYEWDMESYWQAEGQRVEAANAATCLQYEIAEGERRKAERAAQTPGDAPFAIIPGDDDEGNGEALNNLTQTRSTITATLVTITSKVTGKVVSSGAFAFKGQMAKALANAMHSASWVVEAKVVALPMSKIDFAPEFEGEESDFATWQEFATPMPSQAKKKLAWIEQAEVKTGVTFAQKVAESNEGKTTTTKYKVSGRRKNARLTAITTTAAYAEAIEVPMTAHKQDFVAVMLEMDPTHAAQLFAIRASKATPVLDGRMVSTSDISDTEEIDRMVAEIRGLPYEAMLNVDLDSETRWEIPASDEGWAKMPGSAFTVTKARAILAGKGFEAANEIAAKATTPFKRPVRGIAAKGTVLVLEDGSRVAIGKAVMAYAKTVTVIPGKTVADLAAALAKVDNQAVREFAAAMLA